MSRALAIVSVTRASADPSRPGRHRAGIEVNVTRMLKRREEMDRRRAERLDELVRALDRIARQEVEALKPGPAEQRVDHGDIQVSFDDGVKPDA